MTNEITTTAVDIAEDFTAARAVFARLAALFLAIRNGAGDSVPPHVVNLIELGQDVAGDWSNTCDVLAARIRDQAHAKDAE